MELISPVGSASGSASTAGASLSAIEEGQERFIKLLVAQLKNQDPLSPLDNAQFTTQLAQISTVQGIEKLNGVMTEMLSAISAGQQLQAAGLIGRQALVAGSRLTLADGAAQGAVQLAGAADSVKVTVLDAAGTVVRTIDLGAKGAGVATFAWDGRDAAGAAAKPGEYAFRVEASKAGVAVAAETLTSARISGATAGKEGVVLTVAGSAYPLADVRQII
jgi:flagellar basal-body rod modification protein FlgD